MNDNTNLKSIITSSVQKMYDKYPYPNYSLFFRPRWQDAYLASSLFSSALYEHHTQKTAAIRLCKPAQDKFGKKILVIGSGDMLPYILRKYEPNDYKLICVDLSKRSLSRAKFRLMLNRKSVVFIQSDIDEFLEKQGGVEGPFDHVEVYGALHHFYDPSSTLNLIFKHLNPHGTMRLMVYNSLARKWIHNIQSAFRLMKLNMYSSKDKDIARNILLMLSENSEATRMRIKAIGNETLTNNARFVDTFFHPQELRIDIKRWFELFKQSGFNFLGLFDRYGELDDLPNTLWQTPSVEDIYDRALDGRFENNLELYFSKNPTGRIRKESKEEPKPSSIFTQYIKTSPYLWRSFSETKNVKFLTMQRLWWKYINHSSGYEHNKIDSLVYSMPMTALQRLGRLGAFFPSQISDQYLQKSLIQAMASDMEAYDWGSSVEELSDNVRSLLTKILDDKGAFSEKRLMLIMKRFIKAQY